MAQYKVIQDIEAEDKLVGPLTLRQFIYAGVAAVCLYICFLAYSRGAGFLIIFFLPIAAAAGFFSFPWKGEQPTEIWALARARFMLKPRVRIWDQDGVKDLVTVIAPRKAPTYHSSKANMSQNEVRSRLKALADTIDSRGWATRNAAYGISQQWTHPTVAAAPDAGNPLAAMIPSDDMFDEQSSVAQNFDAMLNRSQTQKRERVLQEISQAQNPSMAQQPQPQPSAPIQASIPQYPYAMPQLPTPVMPATAAEPPNLPAAQQAQQSQYWFANGPAYPVNPTTAQQDAAAPYHIESDTPLAVPATPTPEEVSLVEDIRQQNQSAMAINYGHMRVLQPASDPYAASNTGVPINYQGASQIPTPVYAEEIAASSTPAPTAQPVTRQPDPAILELANNDDLDIATIARQAKREIDKSPDEVEIRLH